MIKTERDLVLGYYYSHRDRPQGMSLDEWLAGLRDNSVVLPGYIDQHRKHKMTDLTKRVLRRPEETAE